MHFDWIHAGAILLVVLTLGVTALAAALVWRNGYVRGWRASRLNPPRCPLCKYDLSGLSHCRCPECGTEYRLDVLWRSPVVAPSAEPGSTVDPTARRGTPSYERRGMILTAKRAD